MKYKYIAKNKCLNCNSEMSCKKYQIDSKKFCCKKCHYDYRVKNELYIGDKNGFWGKTHTQKVKDIVAKTWKGKHFSIEHIQKIKDSLSNEKCYAWKGGISLDWWSKRVKERDNDTCQDCGLYEPAIMETHHIKSKAIYPELKTNINNGITLCPNCHKKRTIIDEELKIWKHNKIISV